MTAILNTALTARRRAELGLSQRAIASVLDVGPPVVAAIERGEGHERLTVRIVVLLAHAVGLEPGELFAQRSTVVREPAPDHLKVEAALAQGRQRLNRDALARALGWDLARTQAALGALEERLGSSGQLLHFNRSAGGYSLRARDGLLAESEQQAVGRARLRRSGLTTRQAQLLMSVVEGDSAPSWGHAQSGADRADQGALQRLALVELEQGTPRLSAAAEFSLGIAPARPTRARSKAKRQT